MFEPAEATCHQGHHWQMCYVEKRGWWTLEETPCPRCGEHAAKVLSETSVEYCGSSRVECEAREAAQAGVRNSFFSS